jgi:hypothetical protein
MLPAPKLKIRGTSLLPIRLPRLVYSASAAIAAILAYSAGSYSQTPPAAKAPAQRIDLRPRLVPGEVLLYQVQLQTVTDTKRTGAISDPQGPSQLSVTWGATLKLEVLPVANSPAAIPPAPKPAANKKADPTAQSTPLRIRTTYEHSAANVKSDSPDPQADDIEQTYKRLEGQVIEFTLGAGGHVSDVHGLEGIIDDDKVRQAAEQWVAQVSGPAVGVGGVALGQSWNSAQPAESMPLAGLIWHSNSTYVRNESCRPAESPAPADAGERCAVILTRQSVDPRKQLRDPTPEDYRRNGLHTSGSWAGSGESLSYVSLQTHLVVSVTQDSSQQIDFTVTNSAGQSIRYAGKIETHSRVALLPPDANDNASP